MIPIQSSYLREVRESQKVFSALVSSMERTHKAVVFAIEEKQREEERRVETLVKELKQEIEQLRMHSEDADPLVPDQTDDTKQVLAVSTFIQTLEDSITNTGGIYCHA